MSPRAGLDLSIIMEAAIQLANEKGIQEVTLASLAAKLGVRSPSLYNHVQGLPDLQLKISIHALEKLYEALHQAIKQQAGDEAIRSMVRVYLSFARENPGLYSATLKAPDMEDSTWVAASERIVNLLVQMMQSSYRLNRDTALHFVRIYRSMLHGFASLEQAGGFGMPLDLSTTQEMLIETLLAGIHSQQGG